jgi:hypothetical protein
MRPGPGGLHSGIRHIRRSVQNRLENLWPKLRKRDYLVRGAASAWRKALFGSKLFDAISRGPFHVERASNRLQIMSLQRLPAYPASLPTSLGNGRERLI